MRILLLTQKLPLPLEDGYNLRIRAYVERMAERHEIHLISLDEGGMPDELASCFASVQALPMRDVAKPTSPVRRFVEAFSPDHVHDFDPANMAVIQKTVDEGNFDVLWVSGWRMLPYTHRLENGPPIFGDVIDEGAHESWIELKKARTPRNLLYRFKDYKKVRDFQRKYFEHLTVCNVVSEADREAILRVCPKLNVSVVHNGVDPNYFAPQDVEEDYPSLVFEGSMSHPPNREGIVLFHRDIFPLVREDLPRTRLWVVGRDPTPDVRALAGPDVEVTGFVDDVRPYVAKASVFVCPLVGGAGIKNKILQAWSMEKPVVATTISSGGLVATQNENIVVADDPREFAEACVRLLRDEEARKRLGQKGRETVLAEYSWDAMSAKMEGLMEGLIPAATA